MRGIWAAAFLLRRWRVERGIVVMLIVLVAVTSFLAAGAPRLYNLVADAGLRREVAEASPQRRNIELVQELVVPEGEDPLTMVDGLERTYYELFDPTVQSLVGSTELIATSPRFGLRAIPRFTTYVTMRHQTGLEDSIHLLDGRWPASTGERLPGAALEFGPPPGEVPEVPPRVELAVSRLTAEEAGLEVGQVFEAAVDSSDALLPRALVSPLVARLEIVGIFEVDEPLAEVWYADSRLQRVGADFNADTPVVFVTALIAPEALADLATSNLTFRFEWHYFVDENRLDAGSLDVLQPEMRRLETTFITSTFGSGDPEEIRLRTGLSGVIEDYLGERAASEAVLSVAGIGPLALAAGAIGMLAVLLVARRRAALQLARGRGAGARLILGAQLWEATLLAGAGAIAGLLLAQLIVPGRESSLSVLLSIGTAVVAILLMVGATWPAIRRSIEPAGREQAPPLRTAPRRLVLELTSVVIAVAGVLLLRQRGLTIEGGDSTLVRFDPFLAAVPMLTGFAAGIVATRLYPFPIRALGWLAARRRDLVPVLGLRNVGRRPSFATLPLLVLMLTAAFGSFALVVTSSIERGQIDASWREIGADYRIQAPPGASLEDSDVSGIADVTAVAPAYVNPAAVLELGSGRTSRIRFEALDVAAYQAVAAGGPLNPSWPGEFAGPFDADGSAPAIGTEENPIPAIVSAAMPAGLENQAPGDMAEMRLGDRNIFVRFVDVRSGLPGLVEGTRFIVAPLAAVDAAVLAAEPDGEGVEANLLFVGGPTEAGEQLEALFQRDGPAATVVDSRHAWFEELRSSPLVGAVGDGFRLGFLIAVAYAAIAVIMALTLTAAHRTQDLAFLRSLGLSRGQAAGITVIEHAAPVLVALVPGLATGVVLAMLLESSLGLDAFIGATSAFRVTLDWAGLAAVAALLLAVVAAAVAISTWLARRTPVVEALRVGDA